MTRAHNYEYVKKIIENNGLVLLSKEYSNTKSKIKIKCFCGGIWKTNFATLTNKKSLYRCPECVHKYLKIKQRKDFDDVKKIFNDGGYSILESNYIGNNHRMTIEDSDGYKYFCNYSNFRIQVVENKKRLLKFNVHNPYTIENIKLWIEKNNCKYVFISGYYINNAQKTINLQCKNCNLIYDMCWRDIQNGQNCPYCAGKRVSSLNSLCIIYPHVSREWNYIKNKKSPCEFVSKSSSKAWWICSNCSYEWIAPIVSRTFDNTGCPKCRQSHGERAICEYLNKKEVEYFVQHKFQDCKNKFCLPFDFYIPLFNIAIEYDGELHYEIHRFYKDKKKAEEKLLKIQYNDSIKTKYCNDNKIKLIRIPFWKFDDIENILNMEILLNF